ncbi:MAG: hypothetical protein R2751_19565 [Bacteroidales bacterium]
MKKTLRIVLWILAAGLLLFFSFDVQSLEEHRAGQPETTFDPAVYASDLAGQGTAPPAGTAPALDEVLDGLDSEGDRDPGRIWQTAGDLPELVLPGPGSDRGRGRRRGF